MSNACDSVSSDCKVYYLEDREYELTLDKALHLPQTHYYESKDLSPNIAFSSSALWVKIQLTRDSNHSKVITISNAHLDSLDAYILKGNKLVRQFHTGDAKAFSSRDIPSNYFSFLMNPNEDQLFLRIRSQGSVSTPLRIETLKSYFISEKINQIILWIFYGVVFTSLLANFILYIGLHDKVHLFYMLYVISNAIYTATDFGIGFQYIWPEHPFFNKFVLVYYSVMLCVLVFCSYLLELKSRSPRLYLFFKGLIAAQIACAVVSLFDYNLAIKLFSLLFLSIPLLVFLTAIHIYLKTKSRMVIFFLAGWSFYLASLFIYMLAVMGHITYSGNVANIVVLASSFEMVMLFITIVFKVNLIKEESILAKSQVINLLHEREYFLERQNVVLDQKVKERTLELVEKTDEISSQNEEIISQNEELVSQQQELLKKRQELEIQRMELDELNKAYAELNKRLSIYKMQLEKDVHSRTNDLVKANNELEYKNTQLEQYAFMAAHNLRSPIAALLGLTKIIDAETDPEAFKEIVKRINLSVKKLDSVVRSMSTILNSRNAEDKPVEKIKLEKTLQEALDMLDRDISESNAIITYDFEQCKEINAIPTFMHNLFFNLISNSIKYRKETEAPHVHILSYQDDTYYSLSFTDNGLGIDMQKYGHDLFKPFKRFHVIAEGSGIGLHLVKTQIESMGGTIEIRSLPDEGTLFEIKLPKRPLSTSKENQQ